MVDKRTDIWAFGCVLYEMLTGRRAFGGDDVTDSISRVLQREPDLAALPAGTPPRIVDLLRRCLRKDPRERLRDMGDARLEIEDARVAASGPHEAVLRMPQVAQGRRALLHSSAGAITGALLAALVFSVLRPGTPPVDSFPRQLALSVPPSIELITQNQQGLAISPDGKHLVFPGRRGEVAQLYLRPIEQREALPIPGTEGATRPFFSPDGRWVGFVAGGKLKKITLAGGTPVDICDATQAFHGASWSLDDVIVFADHGLFRVSAAGSTPERITRPDPTRDETDHDWPDLLPGGRAVLFTVWTGGYAHPQIAVQSLATGERRLLFTGLVPRFVPTGHIVFFRAGSLWAVPFDVQRLEVTGSPTPVVEGVHVEWAVWPYFTVANDGTLAYVPGAPLNTKRLVWVDRDGAVAPLSAPPKPYDNPRLSPDDQRVAAVIREDENHDIWTYDFRRGTLTRVTFGPGENETPVWSPDGQRLLFAGNRSGASRLLVRHPDGSGPEEELLGTAGGHRHAYSVAGRGDVLLFEESSATTASDLWVVPLRDARQPQTFLQTPFNEQGGQFSPDSRWIAYASDESGRLEIYVQAYPGGGRKWQISTNGGVEPVWAKSGRELFYRSDKAMWVADVTTQPTFSASAPRVLFTGNYDTLPWASNYDVTRDGQRFLMVQSAPIDANPNQINVVVNWFDQLRRLVPATR